MKKRSVRLLIALVVLTGLALVAYVLVSTVDVVTLLKRIHGG